MPFFKETETNQRCCGCGQNGGRTGFGAPSEIPQVVGINPALTNTLPTTGFINNGGHFMKIENTASVEMIKPVPIGTGTYTSAHVPFTQAFEHGKTNLNANLIHADKREEK
jgi:hypothetical protein